MIYTRKFEIQWAHLDPNRHVANSAYVEFLSETRIGFLHENGFSQQEFESHGIGPVIFAEELFYIKEIKHKETITITLELLANTSDYSYIKFAHCIFNEAGKLSIYSEVFFGWMDLKTRKLVVPPIELQNSTASLSKADNYIFLGDTVNLKNPRIPFGKTLPEGM